MLPGRIVTDVLVVPAGELGDPVAVVVSMKADDAPLWWRGWRVHRGVAASVRSTASSAS